MTGVIAAQFDNLYRLEILAELRSRLNHLPLSIVEAVKYRTYQSEDFTPAAGVQIVRLWQAPVQSLTIWTPGLT